MTRASHWTVCRNRVSNMCKAYNITADMHKGNGRMGVCYSVTFWCGGEQLHELRNLSPSALMDQLSAFDWGFLAGMNVTKDRNGVK